MVCDEQAHILVGGWAVSWMARKSLCISETLRCRKLILEHWLGGVGVHRHGVTLILPLPIW